MIRNYVSIKVTQVLPINERSAFKLMNYELCWNTQTTDIKLEKKNPLHTW